MTHVSEITFFFSRKNKVLQAQHDSLMEKVTALRSQLSKVEKFSARLAHEIEKLNALETPQVNKEKKKKKKGRRKNERENENANRKANFFNFENHFVSFFFFSSSSFTL